MYIDNSQAVRELLEFDASNNYYYAFLALARKKDQEKFKIHGMKVNESRIIQHWIVSSVEEYNARLPEMLAFVEALGVRLYVTLDAKDFRKALMFIRNQCTQQLDSMLYGQTAFSGHRLFRMFNASMQTSECSGKVRRWLFDVDTKNSDVVDVVKSMCGSNFLCSLPTRSGYHIIARKTFNARQLQSALPESVEIKDNALGLVAIS